MKLKYLHHHTNLPDIIQHQNINLPTRSGDGLQYILIYNQYLEISMIEQLTELSKTTPLTNSHTAHEFNILTKKCPKQLLILSDPQSYFCKASLTPKSNKNILEGVFHSFSICIEERVVPKSSITTATTHSGSMKSDHLKYQLNNEFPIIASNFSKFIVKNQEIQEEKNSGKYNQFVDFDRKILRMFMAMRYEQNYQINFHEKFITIDCGADVWRIPLISSQGYSISDLFHAPLRTTTFLIKTFEYLSYVEANLQNSKPESISNQPQSSTQSKIQNSELILQNNLLKQKVHNLESQLTKSTQKIIELQQQIKGIEKELYNHSEMIEIQQNKMMKILDQLQDLKKQRQDKINPSESHMKNSIKNKKGVVTVPDYIREKLSIDLHSSYLGKFQISGNQITYIGENQQATQLLSNRVFSHTSPHKKLHSTLHIIKTQAKCIKFGIIDTKYSTQRSCWNYPHILYLHGWGHTMVSRHEQNHNYCDFGTGSTVQMDVDFSAGWIKWTVNGKREVFMKQYQKLIKSDIEWTPFIAMHNYLDCVQWSMGEN